ncbi:glycosyltransferase [Pleurocapsa sp. PCC 7319]|uniref:glycosyltransferase n=1 Tax=Pleurocapsa sp. PCC 7319 TaxID=118161 RepID=UPI0003480C7C|nr:glycosyltransferase [Pleurocapsa sp. PCC 7319]
MLNNTQAKKSSGLFLVWKNYQRRPEVLASLINCQLKFIPHLFRSKYLRPLDYLIKLVVSIKDIRQIKPDFVVAQCPPTFSALPPWLTKTPYVIDAHNPLFQVKMWQSLPLSKTLLQNAQAIIVHNTEMFQSVKNIYPSVPLFTISDPIEFIEPIKLQKRSEKQILVIASFDPWDEPVDLLIEIMKELAEYNFIVTADINKLAPETATVLKELDNVQLTGFLATEEYHQVLCSSLASLVLTTSEATQPSGACEALSSNTQLIISKTSLTEKLFGEWAVLVENSSESIVKAIRSLTPKTLDLASCRSRWNSLVQQEIAQLVELVDSKK